MKTHTSSFKEQIKLIGKEIDSRITFGDTVLGKDDLNAVTPSYQGAILKSVMKQLDIDSNVEIPIGTILKYEFGLKVNGEYEYINYGNYVVYSIEKQEDTNSYKITCYDKLLYSMLDYVKLPITYPISIRDYINAVSTALGLKFANKSGTFANYDKQIQADLYDGLGYTFRDVLDELAQVTASTICLNNNDELEIRYITETGDTIDEEFLKDVNVNFGEKFGAVNTIVLSRSAGSDNIYYPTVLPTNPYEIKISDNQIMNGNDRADFLPDIYNKLNGLEFYTNDFVSTGIIYYDLCDRYSVKVGDNTYSCVMFNDEVLVTQGLEENVYTELPEQTETDYKHASKDDRMINQVYIIAKKNEAEILAVVNTTNQIQKEINPTKEESGSKIYIEDASNNPLTYLEIEGKSTQETRSGKNELNNFATSQTLNGVNLTVNEDKTMLVNGTTTAQIVCGLSGTIDNIYGGKYLKGSPNGSTNQSYCLMATYYDENNTWQYEHYETGNGLLLRSDYPKIRISILIRNGVTVNNQIFKPMIVDILDTEYEPFGVSPSPDYPSEIESVGYENLFDKDNVISGVINADGSISSNNNYSTSDYIKINSVSNYVHTDTGSSRIKFFDENKNVISTESYTDVSGLSFVSPYANAKYVRFSLKNEYLDTLMFEKGIQQHSYIPYGKYGIEVVLSNKNYYPNSGYYNEMGFGGTLDTETTFNGYSSIRTNVAWAGPYINLKKLMETTNLKVGDAVTYSTYIKMNFVPTKNMWFTLYRATSSGYNISVNVPMTDVIPNEWMRIKTTFTLTEYSLTSTSARLETDYYDSSDPHYFGNNRQNYIWFACPQLEKGDTMTDWVEPVKNSKLFVLDQPPRSLPNGVKDIAYIKNNKLYVDRYVGSIVLDGTQENVYTDTAIGRYDYIISNAKLGGLCLSTHFSYKFAEEDGRIFLSGSQENRICVVNSTKTTLADMNSWLSIHKPQVDYELTEPYTEEYGEIDMPSTFKGVNHISTTDDLEPTINIEYVRDTIIADYVENHVAQLKITESEIKASVESVNSSVDGLNTTINRVEEITTDNSRVINVISTSSSFDLTTGEVREVTTTTGFTFNADGMTIDDGSGFKAEHTADGTYYKDGNSIVGQYTKDGSKQKDLELFGIYSYGKESIDDTPMFIGQLYRDENNEQCFGHFYNGGE